jgi:chromosome segregation protein
MLRWREKVEGLINRLNACDAKKADVGVIEARLSDGKGAIVAFLESAGRVADRASPAAVLFREAKARLEQLQGAWT